MAGETIIFFPKYSSLVAGTYYSDPFDVTGYKELTAEALLIGSVGTSPQVTAILQESSDLTTWTDIGSASTLSSTMSVLTKTDPARYVRMKVVVSGTGAVGTLWSKAVARGA